MNLTEKKKILYKEKPTAYKRYNRDTVADENHFYYWAQTSVGPIFFVVPVKEMGELLFGETEQGQLLIRWIQ